MPLPRRRQNTAAAPYQPAPLTGRALAQQKAVAYANKLIADQTGPGGRWTAQTAPIIHPDTAPEDVMQTVRSLKLPWQGSSPTEEGLHSGSGVVDPFNRPGTQASDGPPQPSAPANFATTFNGDNPFAQPRTLGLDTTAPTPAPAPAPTTSTSRPAITNPALQSAVNMPHNVAVDQMNIERAYGNAPAQPAAPAALPARNAGGYITDAGAIDAATRAGTLHSSAYQPYGKIGQTDGTPPAFPILNPALRGTTALPNGGFVTVGDVDPNGPADGGTGIVANGLRVSKDANGNFQTESGPPTAIPTNRGVSATAGLSGIQNPALAAAARAPTPASKPFGPPASADPMTVAYGPPGSAAPDSAGTQAAQAIRSGAGNAVQKAVGAIDATTGAVGGTFSNAADFATTLAGGTPVTPAERTAAGTNAVDNYVARNPSAAANLVDPVRPVGVTPPRMAGGYDLNAMGVPASNPALPSPTNPAIASIAAVPPALGPSPGSTNTDWPTFARPDAPPLGSAAPVQPVATGDDDDDDPDDTPAKRAARGLPASGFPSAPSTPPTAAPDNFQPTGATSSSTASDNTFAKPQPFNLNTGTPGQGFANPALSSLVNQPLGTGGALPATGASTTTPINSLPMGGSTTQATGPGPQPSPDHELVNGAWQRKIQPGDS